MCALLGGCVVMMIVVHMLLQGQLHPLQPGDSIQFGASTRAYKLFLPAPQQDAAAIKKRARVMFADSVEDEVGHDGGSSSSTSQTFKQKRKLEEVSWPPTSL